MLHASQQKQLTLQVRESTSMVGTAGSTGQQWVKRDEHTGSHQCPSWVDTIEAEDMEIDSPETQTQHQPHKGTQSVHSKTPLENAIPRQGSMEVTTLPIRPPEARTDISTQVKEAPFWPLQMYSDIVQLPLTPTTEDTENIGGVPTTPLAPPNRKYLEDKGSPMPTHNAAGLPDLDLYHTVNYSEGISHYHGQASNDISSAGETNTKEEQRRLEDDNQSGEEVSSFVWQHSKSRRKKKTIPIALTPAQAPSNQGIGYHKQTMPKDFYQTLAISTLDWPETWGCTVIPLYIRKIPSPNQGNGRFITYYLADIATHQRRVVKTIQITRDTTISN